jgi:hypothetical protein
VKEDQSDDLFADFRNNLYAKIKEDVRQAYSTKWREEDSMKFVGGTPRGKYTNRKTKM